MDSVWDFDNRLPVECPGVDQQRSDFAFLRVVGTKNHRPIFRLLHSNGGVAYLEFELVREPTARSGS